MSVSSQIAIILIVQKNSQRFENMIFEYIYNSFNKRNLKKIVLLFKENTRASNTEHGRRIIPYNNVILLNSCRRRRGTFVNFTDPINRCCGGGGDGRFTV